MSSDSKQQQFLNVIDRDEAERRWRAAFAIADGCATEVVDLQDARGRVLAEPVVAPVDVPGFDRSNLDGVAVRAADTWGASEEHPVRLQLVDEVIATAVVPQSMIESGFAAAIATGGMLPRGADAIVMVEHTDAQESELSVYKSVSPGQGLTFAGTDIARGETLYRPGEVLTSRETGVLAAIGVHRVPVYRRPRVGILSTGDEIISPGEAMRPGLVYDSNAQVLADAVVELGGEALRYGIVQDDLERLREQVQRAVAECEIVLLSGGTSKGAGDLSYRVLAEWNDPGIVAHGVALKPGKPICLAVTHGKPVVILPGFPTSAIFTFHEFVADVIARMAGRSAQTRATTSAVLATQVNSEIGRTEYLLVGLVHQDLHAEGEDTSGREAGDTPPSKTSSSLSHDIGLAAYPMGKGSGSVTTFARADGFVTIDRHTEIVEQGDTVEVTLLGQGVTAADLVVLGSHCVGLDFLLGELQRVGMRSKFLAIGSTAGLRAVERGECDLAGIHLLDAASGQYNQPFLSDHMELIPGYRRKQGIVFRAGDARFAGKTASEVLERVTTDPQCVMVNRNQGSGTRILIDQWLEGAQPPGYAVQARSHNAVAASVAQERSDWGMAIETVASGDELGFLALRDEQYDFAVRRGSSSPSVQQFRDLLQQGAVRDHLRNLGFQE